MPNTYQDFTDIPVTSLKKVKQKPEYLEFLEKLRISNLSQLLLHLPSRYEDKVTEYTLNQVPSGSKVNVRVLITNKVLKPSNSGNYKEDRLVAHGVDKANNQVSIWFFRMGGMFRKLLEDGKEYLFYGTVKLLPYNNEYQIHHPEIIDPSKQKQNSHALTPIYSTTKGFKQASIRSLIKDAFSIVDKNNFPELKPAQGWPKLPIFDKDGEFKGEVDINNISLLEAIKYLHFPPVGVKIFNLNKNDVAISRIIAEEALANQLSLLQAKQALRHQPTIVLNTERNFVNQIIKTFPYELTNAQKRAVDQIIADMASGQPMIRLVQGDVGSGKTIVALLAIAQAIDHGLQCGLLAPTDILATQLYENARDLLQPFGVNVVLVTGKLTAKERRIAQELIRSGQVNLVVGTHVVFGDWLEYENLGLVVIDEQHRFGVEQRLAFTQKQKNFKAHTLMMSATPAPRTLTMLTYADMDLTIIDELPPGRTPVKTTMYSQRNEDHLLERIYKNIKENHKQVYWVCPLIEENETISSTAAEIRYQLLVEHMPGVRIGLVHGKMKASVKDEIINAFKNRELDLLVATTVIEVGVNVPNASIMIIENPERLGLSQIHQLRGRVGRGSIESFCVLFHGDNISSTTKERLSIFTETNDGFKIAEKDLENRGGGDIVGTRQHGEQEFFVADIYKNREIFVIMHELAKEIIKHEPELAKMLTNRWLQREQDFLGV